MDNILNILKDKTLTYEMKVLNLAREAENLLDVLKIDKETKNYINKGIICDLFEGNAPYRPRYIVPDYEYFMENGSDFLKLDKPSDIWEATNNLLILYKHVPSITSFPVYIGNIDTLLDKFIIDDLEAYKAIKLFLKHIDRTITDSFCHANIGPKGSKASKLILKAQRELQTSIPNITLKYSEDTPEELAIDSINTCLITAKPSFANHHIFSKEFGEDYAIVSCYNGLPIGGGSYTLVRLNLYYLAKHSRNIDDFITNKLPKAVKLMNRYIDERIRFIVEESNFFESSFLAREKLISINKFTAMFGIFGLAECVNHFVKPKELKEKFGHSNYANELGYKIIEEIYNEVNKHNNKYVNGTGGKFLLHAQVGIDTDNGISPGCRIPIGDEPEIYEHLIQSSRFHKFFPSGIGDVFKFDETFKKNPEAILDIIKGGFKNNLRYFSFYSSDSDVIRITGYLVKKSEIEKLEKGQQVLRDTVALGLGSCKNNNILNRKLIKND